jgi:putative ABC transport system substrate-binding protein
VSRAKQCTVLVVAAVLFGILAWPPPSRAQAPAKVFRLALLLAGTPVIHKHQETALREGLRQLGYVEGQNLVIVSRYAEGKLERLPALAAELVQSRPDVIVTSGVYAIRAVKHATETLPVVMAVIADPVAEGLVTSFARPGGNLTGMAFQNPELTAKRLELLKQAVPKARRIAVLWDSTALRRTSGLSELQAAAPSLGLTLQVLEVRGPADFDAAFGAARRGRADALVVLAGSLLFFHRQALVDLAAKSRLPAMYVNRLSVDAGGLMSYGPSIADMFHRSAAYVDKILKGAKPGDLPIEQASRFELVVNARTAKSLGLTIPPSVLQRADEVIR